jgi:hypothetical protein
LARARAVARPIPRDAPVTRAVLVDVVVIVFVSLIVVLPLSAGDPWLHQDGKSHRRIEWTAGVNPPGQSLGQGLPPKLT